MAGRALRSESGDVLAKIRGFVRLMLEGLRNGRLPSVALDRFKTYCSDPYGDCSCSSDLPCGKDIVSLESKSHAYRIDIMLRVLLIIQQLLQENKHASKRDIYYMEPSVFQDQGNVDRAINDICILLECSRHHLNVVPMGKGYVLSFSLDEIMRI
ncbi:Spo11/DNA topoisomerase VI subunit A protein [Dioscorea alata]|uniref:Spo11/DNA topoisomerase VI subunit A protein n=1 Tax=Dioscorea alata TaxID=55571 RepID=A0ACB7UJK6_DIOAL|nr:Spo11/DNA topoisomerase VI subunit A protein [Dioscorea alata]